jgi:two-component system, LytTR family, response regulator AlgR
MPTPLQVLIVDDEPLARLRLRSLLEAPGGLPVQVVGEAGDASAALAVLARQPCDLLLLDIALPGRDGLKLAEALHQAARPPAVVFVTAHAEHALRAFELEAVDYLTKPVRRDRLAMALARVQRQRATTTGLAAADDGPVLVVSDRGRVLRVPATEVLYLKAEQKYVTLCSSAGRWLIDEPLADLEQRLGNGFLRVHRNAVVALSAVRALAKGGEAEGGEEGWQLQLANGEWLAVSRRQVAAVRDALARGPAGAA